MRGVALVALLFLVDYRVGCDCAGPPLRTTGGDLDAGATPPLDAGLGVDSGPVDSGARLDAGATADAGTDSGLPMPDAGAPDAGAPDAGAPDAGAPDAGLGPTHPAGTIVARVPLPGAYGVAIAPSGLLYVTSVTAATVAHGDVATRSFATPQTPVSSTPVRVLFTGNGSRAFVAHQNGSVGPITVLESSTHQPVATVATPGGVIAIARSAEDARAFFGLVNVGSLLELNPDGGGYVARAFPAVGTGVATVGLAFDEARNALYGTNDARTVFRYDFPTGANAQSLSVPSAAPKQVAYAKATSTLYVANELGNLLAFQAGPSALTALPFATADGGSTKAFGIALTPDGQELWLSDSSAGVLRIVNLASLEVREVTGAGRPRDIAFDATGTTAVVANELGEVLFLE